MKDILTQLYNGEIFPAEQYRMKTETYQEMHRKQYQRYESFINKLKLYEPSLHEEFIELMDEQLSTIPNEFSESFIHGFRLGTRIMIEIYQNDLKT